MARSANRNTHATAQHILDTARLLFNTGGVAETSLRHIAKAADIAYGNLTYHFRTKDLVVMALWRALWDQVAALSGQIATSGDMLQTIVTAPMYSFDYSLRYRFFSLDHAHLMRQYPVYRSEFLQLVEGQKQWMLLLLPALQATGEMRQDVSEQDFLGAIESNVYVSIFWFQRHCILDEGMELDTPDSAQVHTLRQQFVRDMAVTLRPWLTETGRTRVDAILHDIG